jgi:hypothetical protein
VRRGFYLKPVKRNNPVLLILFFALFCFACGKEKISEEVLIKVYVENIIADQTFTNNADSLRIHKKNIFKKYGLTEKEFESELGKYSQDKEAWASFFRKANNYLDELNKSNAIN